MKPNDENGKLKLSERPFRVLSVSGSNRRQYNCPGVDSKSRALMLRMAERLPQEWEIDYEDLGNVYGREHIQGCSSCVWTSMALCCWPCNCYERQSHAPLVWQCRYSGIEVPDHLWRYVEFGKGRKYSDNQSEHMAADAAVLAAFDDWTDTFARFVDAKGKVEPIEPGKYRAFGHSAPGHTWADIKLYARDLAMRVGHPPAGSSPRTQDHGLNRDERLVPKKSEGQRLRED